jgi:hypothetical protein
MMVRHCGATQTGATAQIRVLPSSDGSSASGCYKEAPSSILGYALYGTERTAMMKNRVELSECDG